MPQPSQLHLGCGDFAPDGWLNSDGSWHVKLARWPRIKRLAVWGGLLPRIHLQHPWPAHILSLDVRHPLPFPEHTLTAVYASHVLEHLYRTEALALLRELHRCCRPGAVVRMAVPHLAHYIADYQRGWIDPHAPGHSPADTLLHRLHLRPESPPDHGSLLRTLYHLLLDFNSHKWLYDRDSLLELFQTAGFPHPEERAILDSRIPAIDRIERADRIGGGGTLIVEAVKPG
ncbi:MAG: methyltransferase domain-containing protein [Magnetococcales bacterium]|nr:methyltransferase domain-containing protein [Magnetococcales bacterium]